MVFWSIFQLVRHLSKQDHLGSLAAGALLRFRSSWWADRWADRAAAVGWNPPKWGRRTLNLKIFSFWIWWFHHFFRTIWVLLLTISSAAKECLKDEENMETGKGTLHIQCGSKDDHTKQNLSIYIFTEMTVPKTLQGWCQISARKGCFWWWEVTPLEDWGKYNFI